jgi:hypothetical protein
MILARLGCRLHWPPRHAWTREKLEDGHVYFRCARCGAIRDPVATAKQTWFVP